MAGGADMIQELGVHKHSGKADSIGDTAAVIGDNSIRDWKVFSTGGVHCLNGSLLVSSNSTCKSSNVLSFFFCNVYGHVVLILNNSKTAGLCPSPDLVSRCELWDWSGKRLSHWLSVCSLALAGPGEKGVHPGTCLGSPVLAYTEGSVLVLWGCPGVSMAYSINLPLVFFHSFNFGVVQQIPERKLIQVW